ncbi:MAG: hypothetical protein M3007_07320 [Candidatus Eremiobacteraeota bacterium]|nr:hypothetical protein [Candidatus Eremiobacteraeota bacterium]
MARFSIRLRAAGVAVCLAICVVEQSAAVAAIRQQPGSPARTFLSSRSSLPAFMTFAAVNSKTPVLFVSDNETNAVYLYNANDLHAPPIGKITSGINAPTALAVDAKGVLYVSNATAVTAYRPGAVQPFRTITAARGTPYSIAVSPDGTLAISYEPARSLFTPGTLVIFDRGSATPTRTISIPLNNEDLVTLRGLAIDAADNVFLSVGRYPRGGGMVKFAPGSTQSVNLNIGVANGQAFDARGNFYVCFGNFIDVFAPGATQPFRQISNGLNSGTLITVSSDGRIFAPNVELFDFGTNQDIPGNVVEYGPTGVNPLAIRQAADDVDPRAVALRSPSR